MQNPRIISGTIVVFAIVLGLTMTLSLRLSTLQPPFGSLLFGAPSVWRGHTAIFRVAAIDSAEDAVLRDVLATVRLRDATGARDSTSSSGRDWATLAVRVPTDLVNPAWLDVTVVHNGEEDSFSAAIHALDIPDASPGELRPWSSILRAGTHVVATSTSVALYPNNGAVVGGLDNEVRGRITRDGAPWRTTLRIDGVQGPVDSDDDGLFAWSFRPLPHVDPRLHIGDVAVDVPLDVRPIQLLARTTPPVWVAPGDNVEVALTSLPFRGPIFVDLWVGDTLVSATSTQLKNGAGAILLPIPSDARGLGRVTAYRSLLAPTDNASTHVFWIGANDAAIDALPGSDPLREVLNNTRPEARRPLREMLLSRFITSEPGPPLLRNTTAQRGQAFAEEKAQTRASLHTFFGSAALLGFAIAFTWVAMHQRRLRRDLGEVVRDGIAAGEDFDPRDAARMSRVTHVLNLVLTLAALALAGYGLIALLTRMRWV